MSRQQGSDTTLLDSIRSQGVDKEREKKSSCGSILTKNPRNAVWILTAAARTPGGGARPLLVSRTTATAACAAATAASAAAAVAAATAMACLLCSRSRSVSAHAADLSHAASAARAIAALPAPAETTAAAASAESRDDLPKLQRLALAGGGGGWSCWCWRLWWSLVVVCSFLPRMLRNQHAALPIAGRTWQLVAWPGERIGDTAVRVS